MTTVAVMGSMAFPVWIHHRSDGLNSPSPFRAKDPVTNLTALVEMGHRVSR